MFFSTNIIELQLQTLGEIDMIRVKVTRLLAEWRQSLRRLRCGQVRAHSEDRRILVCIDSVRDCGGFASS
jgi:hypothetical protein